MNIEQVKQAMTETPKGANIVVEWTRNGKIRKGVASLVQKQVRMVGRIGIEYDNMKAVQEKRDNGTLPSENQGLPWGRFEIYPYLIEHKGNRYLRLYKGTSATVKPHAHWLMDGNEVSREVVAPMLLASEMQEKDGDCFCVNVNDITRLNAETLIGETEQVKVGKSEPVLVNVG